MRTVLIWICTIGFAAAIGAAQQEAKKARRHFEPPSVVTATEAVYPLQSVVSGTVVLEVSLDDDAKITDIRVVRGIASLTEPAEHSVRQWTFQAASFNGKPVSSKIVVAFSFVPPNVGPRVQLESSVVSSENQFRHQALLAASREALRRVLESSRET